MRVLVVGNTAFLGSFIVDELLRRGHEVAVLGRQSGAFAGPVLLCEADPANGSALQEAITGWRPEGLVDLGNRSPEAAASTVAVCEGKLARSVHISRAAVYGSSAMCPVDEGTDAASPEQCSPDIAQQIEADNTVLEAASRGDLPAVVIRLAELYGPRDPRCAEWFFARRALDGRTRVALPDAGLHICHRGFVQNVAWGIVQALSAPRAIGQVYNLGDEKLYTLAQLAQGVARALDHKWDLYSVPGRLWTTPYAETRFFDLRKARAQLRYKDRMIPRDGLELMLAWLCQHPRGDDWSWPGIESPFDYQREDELIEQVGVELAT